MFKNVASRDDVLAASYRFPGGLSRTTLVRTASRWLAYSPGLGLEKTAKDIVGKGPLDLFAPSAAHVMGLQAWKDAFPRARLVATPVAQKRIRKETGLACEPHDVVDELAVHRVPSCRSGEAWVTHGDALITCDVVMNLRDPMHKNFFVRLGMSAYGLRPGLDIPRLFQRFMFKDKARVIAFAREVSNEIKPRVLIPCHGEILEGDDVGPRVVAMLERRLS